MVSENRVNPWGRVFATAERGYFMGNRKYGPHITCSLRDPDAAAVPENVEAIRKSLAHVTERGYFAPVAVASAGNPVDPSKGVVPLYRGHGMNVRFTGLEAV